VEAEAEEEEAGVVGEPAFRTVSHSFQDSNNKYNLYFHPPGLSMALGGSDHEVHSAAPLLLLPSSRIRYPLR
jgi:hypothetical protein